MRSEGLKIRWVRSPGSTRRDSERTMSLLWDKSDSAPGDRGHLSMLQLRLRKKRKDLDEEKEGSDESKWDKSLHSQNVSGSHSCSSLVLRRRDAHPDWLLCLFPWTWLFLETWEFAGWSKFVVDTGVRTADFLGIVCTREVVRRLRVVFNGQLQWSACVLDHTVYLEGRIRCWPLFLWMPGSVSTSLLLLYYCWNRWMVWGLPRLEKCCRQGCR